MIFINGFRKINSPNYLLNLLINFLRNQGKIILNKPFSCYLLSTIIFFSFFFSSLSFFIMKKITLLATNNTPSTGIKFSNVKLFKNNPVEIFFCFSNFYININLNLHTQYKNEKNQGNFLQISPTPS